MSTLPGAVEIVDDLDGDGLILTTVLVLVDCDGDRDAMSLMMIP